MNEINNEIKYIYIISEKCICVNKGDKMKYLKFRVWDTKKEKTKRYFLKLKEKYYKIYRITIYGITNGLIYLNHNKKTNELFISSSEPYKEFQTQFTTEEIEKIKKLDYINFEQFELIEVGEDE